MVKGRPSMLELNIDENLGIFVTGEVCELGKGSLELPQKE